MADTTTIPSASYNFLSTCNDPWLLLVRGDLGSALPVKLSLVVETWQPEAQACCCLGLQCGSEGQVVPKVDVLFYSQPDLPPSLPYNKLTYAPPNSFEESAHWYLLILFTCPVTSVSPKISIAYKQRSQVGKMEILMQSRLYFATPLNCSPQKA